MTHPTPGLEQGLTSMDAVLATVPKLTKDMHLMLADMAKHPGRSGDWWVRFGEYSAQTLAGLRRRDLIVEDKYTGTLSRSTWRLNLIGEALLTAIRNRTQEPS